MNEKCIICDVKLTNIGVFLCERHIKELNEELKNGKNIIDYPSFDEHCMICGEWKNRKIINCPKWSYVCSICLNNAQDAAENI